MQKMTAERLNELTAEYGDSFYILDSDVFKENCEALLAAFRKYYEKTNIAYSYKTNYVPPLGRIVNGIGGFAEVVSEMEREIASRIGVSPDRIVWNGPVKPQEKTEAFLLAGGTVNIDNYREFLTIKDIAARHSDRKISVGLRCNYDIGDGVLSRFGVDTESGEFGEILETIASAENLHLKALQAHFAKRHHKYWTAKAEGLLSVYEKVSSRYGLAPEYLDLGGGMSGNMPAELREQLGLDDFTFDDYASKAAAAFSRFFKDRPERPWLIIEPGTAVAADCMRYVCRVESVKEVRGKTIITTNGSQKNISMGGLNPPMEVIPAGGERHFCTDADIAGYTCIENDYLYKGFSGEIAIGDHLVIGSCGSYSVVMKPPFIFPNVPVIDISSGAVTEIKRAETFDDLFGTYHFG